MGHHRLDTLAGGASSDGRFRRIATRSILLAVSVALVDPLQTAACALAAGVGRAVIFLSSTSFCSELAPSDTSFFFSWATAPTVSQPIAAVIRVERQPAGGQLKVRLIGRERDRQRLLQKAVWPRELFENSIMMAVGHLDHLSRKAACAPRRREFT